MLTGERVSLRLSLNIAPLSLSSPAISNGAVCGALMGCKFGYSGLPEGLLAFQHRAWLDTQVYLLDCCG